MHVLPPEELLLDCRRLFLRNYEVWINIGVHDFEKQGEQRVLINVDLYVPLACPHHARPTSSTRCWTTTSSAAPSPSGWPKVISTCRRRWPTTMLARMLAHPQACAPRA
jgi:hypothetical protein